MRGTGESLGGIRRLKDSLLRSTIGSPFGE